MTFSPDPQGILEVCNKCGRYSSNDYGTEGNDLLYLLKILSSVCMKQTMDTSVIGSSLLRMKLELTFVILCKEL